MMNNKIIFRKTNLTRKIVSFNNFFFNKTWKSTFVSFSIFRITMFVSRIKFTYSYFTKFFSSVIRQFSIFRCIDTSTYSGTVSTSTLIDSRLTSQKGFTTIRTYNLKSFGSNRSFDGSSSTNNRTILSASFFNFSKPCVKSFIASQAITTYHTRVDYTNWLIKNQERMVS